MDTRRLVLFVIFSMSILMLWDAWQRQHAPAEVVAQTATSTSGVSSNGSVDSGASIITPDNSAMFTNYF